MVFRVHRNKEAVVFFPSVYRYAKTEFYRFLRAESLSGNVSVEIVLRTYYTHIFRMPFEPVRQYVLLSYRLYVIP